MGYKHGKRPLNQEDNQAPQPTYMVVTGSKQFSGKFCNLLFLAVFNFWGHFEGPNEYFSISRFSMILKCMDPPKLISLMTPFQRAIISLKQRSYAKVTTREVDVLTYPNKAHMTFGTSSPKVRFLDV
jgi:hypothetical protein